ncbi:hypothetical protein [Sandaracinobacteroides hominis]|uniref:hypothetical protein n=1 Tax=Sandaracinobacteroides hominis TaxID=2780086 RepID=UPI0018F68BD1|nr:hypothetical protein [Sandaracinobacteroides hominis]
MAFRHLLMAVAALVSAPALAADVVGASFAPICGKAFAGRVVISDALDRDMAGERLVMQVRMCGDGDVRIPFHVGANASRTWMLSRTAAGWRLKHRHMHADGTADALTNYGGEGMPVSLAEGGWRIEFPADAESKAMFLAQDRAASVANVWAMEHLPGKLFAYELKRPGRFLRVEFDLSKEVAAPAAPWGVPVEP